jgi:hypothetical protein
MLPKHAPANADPRAGRATASRWCITHSEACRHLSTLPAHTHMDARHACHDKTPVQSSPANWGATLNPTHTHTLVFPCRPCTPCFTTATPNTPDMRLQAGAHRRTHAPQLQGQVPCLCHTGSHTHALQHRRQVVKQLLLLHTYTPARIAAGAAPKSAHTQRVALTGLRATHPTTHPTSHNLCRGCYTATGLGQAASSTVPRGKTCTTFNRPPQL